MCLVCPAGRYCPKLGTREPSKCAAGKYSDAGAKKCTFCAVGTYCPNEATTREEVEYQKCPAGVFCRRVLSNEPDTDPTNDQTTMVSGQYGLKDYPNLRDNYCSEGYYCTYGATSMTPCPIGTVNRLRGRTS